MKKRKPLRTVPGSVFSPEQPTSRTQRSNANTNFFVADKPQESKTTYLVRFRAKLEQTPIELA